MKDSTGAIRIQPTQSEFREHSSPIFLTSSFQYGSAEEAASYFSGELEGDMYSRFTNPNTSEFVKKLCFLEDLPAGVSTSSGMAAIFATLAAHLKSGDTVVASASLFGNTLYILKNILPKWGINVALIDTDDVSNWEKAIKDQPNMVLIETPTNPDLKLIDLEWMGSLCKSSKCIFAVDNCFATPILQKPAHFGADLVIHSATKFIDGQGRILGGAILGQEEYIQPIFDFLRRTGSCLSPFNAWMLSKSLETLEVRMKRHCENALKLAEYLESSEQVNSVNYPFLPSFSQYELAKQQMKMGGGIVCCELKGGKQAAYKFINNLNLITITANLGDTRTIVTHPASTTHSKLTPAERLKAGITDGMLRFSVGLEDIDDIKYDIHSSMIK